MAHVTIPDQASYVTYAAQTGTGPFTVPFAIFEKADLSVTVGSTELGQSDFSYAETSSTTGGFQTGEITLGVAASAQDILIYRKVNPKRTTDFAIGPLAPNAINSALDRIHAQLQDNKRDLDRALKLDFGDTATAAQVADMLALGAIIPQIEQVADIDAEVVITAGLASSISEIAAALPTMEIIAREIDPFDTLAALMATAGSSFVTGSVVQTKGNISVGDGCAARYVIYDTLPKLSDGTTNWPVDNYGVVCALTGSKWAINEEFIKTREICPHMVGADGKSTNQKTYLDRWFTVYQNFQTTAIGGSVFGDDQQIIAAARVGRWSSSTAVEYAPTKNQFRLRGAGAGTVFEKVGFALDGLLEPEVSNLSLDGGGSATRGLYLGGTARNQVGTFHDLEIANYTTAAVDVRRDSQSRFQNCFLYNSGTTGVDRTGNLVMRGTGGTLFTNTVLHSGKRDNICIDPEVPDSGSIGVGELKMVNCASWGAARHNLYATGYDTAMLWESYFDQLTCTIERSSAPERREYTVSSITNNGGFVQYNFSAPHQLSRNLIETSMEFVGAVYTHTSIAITEVVSDVAVKTNKTYVGNDTGTLSLKNWDIFIEGQGTTTLGIFQLFINSGNCNYAYIGQSDQVAFGDNFRIKSQRWVSDEARNVTWPAHVGGFTYGNYADTEVPVCGPGAFRGHPRSEFVPGDPATLHPGQWRIRAAHYNSGLGADQEANDYNDITVDYNVIELKTASNGGVQITGPASGLAMTVKSAAGDNVITATDSGGDDYLDVTNQTGSVRLSATGASTNVDFWMRGKGTGVIKFGTRTAIGAETVTGYITIKDDGGTTRKLAVVS